MFEDIVVYLIVGVIAGLLSGMLGIGSGVFVVPVLVFLFAHNNIVPVANAMHVAAGTSLACIFVMTSRSLLGHVKRRISFWPIYRLIFPGIIVGTIGGAVLAHFLHSRTLSIIFGIIIFLLGLKMFFPPPPPGHRKLPGPLGCSSISFFIGLKSGLLGLGGGSVSTPFLTHFGVPIRQAVVVATMVSITVSIVGANSFLLTGLHATGLPPGSTGYIYWPAWLGIVVGSLVSIPFGVWLSHRLPTEVLRHVFAVFLLIVGLHMLYSVWVT